MPCIKHLDLSNFVCYMFINYYLFIMARNMFVICICLGDILTVQVKLIYQEVIRGRPGSFE